MDRSLGAWHLTGGTLWANSKDGNKFAIYEERAENLASAGFDIRLVGELNNRILRKVFGGGYKIQDTKKLVSWCTRHPEIFAERRGEAGSGVEGTVRLIRNELDNLRFLRKHKKPFLGQTKGKCMVDLRCLFKELFPSPAGTLP